MASLIVPRLDEEPWPTLGPQVCDHIETVAVFGPGPLKGQPAKLSPEKRAIVYRAYEVYPRGHELAGRRRFKRVAWSVRKGLAKTELLAWIAFEELHPEAPVRCDGFDARGNPVGRPVASPYIPILSYTKDQVEELAFGALHSIVSDSPDADLFDIALERILRLDRWGREDGKALPLAQSPNARDGARTTFQGFDEPHRMYSERIHDSHNTMSANLPKRPDADAWSFYVGTAGQPGQGSIQEDLHHEAQQIDRGEVAEPRIFYFHRDAGRVHRGDKAHGHNVETKAGRIAAIREATGPDGEYGPGQFADIAEQWDRPKADKAYLERVWLNLWTQAARQAFDTLRIAELTVDERIQPGALVTAGFDGARFRDSTAIVLTDVETGLQEFAGLWERPVDVEEWEVPEEEVTGVVDEIMSTYQVWRFNGDPPHWVETMGTWSGRHDCVEEWWTNRTRAMVYALRDYNEALLTGEVKFALDSRLAINSPVPDETLGAALARHLGNAGRLPVNIWDDAGAQLWLINKLHETRKMDGSMAAVLSWAGRIEALRKGAKRERRRSRTVRRMGR